MVLALSTRSSTTKGKASCQGRKPREKAISLLPCMNSLLAGKAHG